MLLTTAVRKAWRSCGARPPWSWPADPRLFPPLPNPGRVPSTAGASIRCPPASSR
ncbi:TPA_asm: UL6.5 sORF 3 [Human alphaherpesvirus 1]|nr:TPA_asm: UL6.5 sORF 3 [Human alphaherpesvirus 1]